MAYLFLMMLILFPAVALSASQADGEREKTAVPQSSQSGAADSGNPGTAQGEDSAEFRRIDEFTVQMTQDWLTAHTPKDESVALIVNPFSIRKRGRFYGSLYEYHRNDNFDARNFFDPVGQPLPEFKRNQFGFSMGAFVTGKLKAFGSYDGLRIIKGSTMLSLVPTAAMKNGDFSSLGWTIRDPFTGVPFEGNRIPVSRINPVAARLLSLFPDPNREDPARNYLNNQPFVNNNNTISTRVDYEFSSRTKIFGNYRISDGSQSLASALPSFGTSMDERRQDVSIDMTHSFSPSKVLSLQLRYARSASIQLSKQAYQSGLLESLGIEGVSVLDDMDEGYPQIDLMGYAQLGFGFGFAGGFPNGFAGGSPETFHENQYGIKGEYTYIHGSHDIGIGGTLDSVQLNNMRTWGTRRGQFGFSGQFTGDAFADFLLGIPYAATRGIGSNRSDLRKRSWRVFVKDAWKINRNFTLTMGLAYSFSPFWRSTHDNVSLFFPLLFEPPLDGEIVVTGSSRARELGLSLEPGHAAYDDRNDWQPSLGLAYSPFGNNRLVLRASYQMQHIAMNPIQGLVYIGRNYPFFYLERAQSPTTPDLDLSRPFASATPAALTLQATDPYLRNSYIQQRELSLQYEFRGSWNLELAYEGRKTTRMLRAIPGNVPNPAPFGEPIQPRRPNPNYGQFDILTSGGSFSNNGLNAQLRRRLTGAFSVQGGFLWNRGISDGWGWMFANPNNPRNLAAERSMWGFTPPWQFNLNYILDLPVGRGKLLSTGWAGKLGILFEGWRISGITTIASGWPFYPEIFGDPNNDGVWGDRPNRIGPGTLPAEKRSVDKWFETSDFTMPVYGGSEPQWFGNAGRNVLLTPGEQKWDISFVKRTAVTSEGSLLEFRVQLFNAFNHVNFQQPGNIMGTPTFGVISNAENAREIEIAVKYTF